MQVSASTAAAQPAAASQEEIQRARLAAFRTFAQSFVGEWTASIEEYDAAGKVIWSDTQRRLFAFTMSRHFLEERAMLKRDDGTSFEGGLHLTTWDPSSDSIVQHGFWLPRQPDPIFRVAGKISGTDFIGEMELREADGSKVVRKLTMRWQNPDRWVLEAHERKSDGSSFVKERLTYSRIPKSG